MLRLGIVDFDSSHAVEFARRFNHVGVTADQYVDGAKVVAGWPGSSRMAPERIPGFTKDVAAAGVELVDSSAALMDRIDAVLVLSLAGDAHLERVRPFLKAGIPAYVDKPFACSAREADEMVRLSREHNVLMWQGSAVRFCSDVTEYKASWDQLGPLNGAVSFGPAKRAEGNPGLFHYGIHPTEMLFAAMGPGCERVTNACVDGAEVVTGWWRDGRVATLRGNRVGATAYGILGFHEKGVVRRHVSLRDAYRNLCRAIVQGFETGQPPVPPEESLEVTRFILAAAASEARGGEPVALSESD